LLFFNVLLSNEIGYRLFFEFETNAYKNKNLEINFWNRIYFGRNDFRYISPSHFSFYWEGFYYFEKFFIYYIHNCENGIDKNAYDNRRWDLIGLGFNLKNFRFILGHVVSPFKTSYDNQNYLLGLSLKGYYKFLKVHYLLILTEDKIFKQSFQVKLDYPIYYGFERRMDMMSIYNKDEKNIQFFGFGFKKQFDIFEFYNLFNVNFSNPSYNVIYFSKFGYNFLNFDIEGKSTENRWTPEIMKIEVFVCNSFCLKSFSIHKFDLNYFNNLNYNFDNTDKFPFSIAFGYKENAFGFFYYFLKRNFEDIFELSFHFKQFSLKIYFDDLLNISYSYSFYFSENFFKTKIIFGVFKNGNINLNNFLLGVALSLI